MVIIVVVQSLSTKKPAHKMNATKYSDHCTLNCDISLKDNIGSMINSFSASVFYYKLTLEGSENMCFKYSDV